MDTISSSDFRKTYPRLTEPTTVTANGYIIGVWSPAPYFVLPEEAQTVVDPPWPVVDVAGTPTEVRYLGNAKLDRLRATQTQAERDAILRRVNKG